MTSVYMTLYKLEYFQPVFDTDLRDHSWETLLLYNALFDKRKRNHVVVVETIPLRVPV